MGCALSKRCALLREESRLLRAKLHALEEEIRMTRLERDREARRRELTEAALAAKQCEWKRDRRRHREEVSSLKRKLAEEERRRKALEEEHYLSAAAAGGGGGDKEQQQQQQQRLDVCRLVEQMKAEQVRREQAVEKWKQLYLAIKTELDALILRTKQGERWCCAAEEDAVEQLQRELKAKVEIIEELRSRLLGLEVEAARRDREVDILRQSLRILGSKKRSHCRKNLVRSLRSSPAGRRSLQLSLPM